MRWRSLRNAWQARMLSRGFYPETDFAPSFRVRSEFLCGGDGDGAYAPEGPVSGCYGLAPAVARSCPTAASIAVRFALVTGAFRMRSRIVASSSIPWRQRSVV